uniref:Zinc knuckle CX2CX4HX4C domain-containing protein n=1 Tax=Chenopodium quinoa TaxID=63459 RepID=A0A803L0Q7_CHEQI
MGGAYANKFLVDIDKPLRRGLFLEMGQNKSRWIDIKYERLAEFCFFCGRLDNTEKECHHKEQAKDAESKIVYQYGPWLRDSPKKRSKIDTRERELEIAWVDKLRRLLFPPHTNQEDAIEASPTQVKEAEFMVVNKDDGEKSVFRTVGILRIVGDDAVEEGKVKNAKKDVQEGEEQVGRGYKKLGADTGEGEAETVLEANTLLVEHSVKEDVAVEDKIEEEGTAKEGKVVRGFAKVISTLCLRQMKKKGGKEFNLVEAEILRNAIDVGELEDLGYLGHAFTWTNNRGGDKNVQERLDRFLVNKEWRELFSGAFVTYLSKRKSDHVPILLCISEGVGKVKKKKFKKRFKFEEMWLREETCADIIENAWNRGGDICSKIAHTPINLSAWSRNKFGDFLKEMKDCRARMEELMKEDQTMTL